MGESHQSGGMTRLVDPLPLEAIFQRAPIPELDVTVRLEHREVVVHLAWPEPVFSLVH